MVNVAWKAPAVEKVCERCEGKKVILHRPGTKPPGSPSITNPVGEADMDLDWVASLCPEHDWPPSITGQ